MSLSFNFNLSAGQLPRLQSIDSISADDADQVSLPEVNQELSFSGEVSFSEANPSYQEILKLDRFLTAAGIPHRTSRLFDGWKISYTPYDKEVSDVVEHFGSCGMENDRMEINGLADLIRINPAKIFDTLGVYGDINALEVFVFWSQNYRKINPQYRKGNFLTAWREVLKTFPAVSECSLLRLCYNLAKKPYADMLDCFSSAELAEIFALAVLFEDAEFIAVLTGCQTRKHLISYILDELIQTAINQKNYDIQLILTDYKHRNHLYREKKFYL